MVCAAEQQSSCHSELTDSNTSFIYSDASVWFEDQALSFAWVEGAMGTDNRPVRSGGKCFRGCEGVNSARAEAYGILEAMEQLWESNSDLARLFQHRSDNQGDADLFKTIERRPLSAWAETADAGLWWQIWWWKTVKWRNMYCVVWQRSHIEKRKADRRDWSQHEHGNFSADQLADALMMQDRHNSAAREAECPDALNGQILLQRLGLTAAFDNFAQDAFAIFTKSQLMQMRRKWIKQAATDALAALSGAAAEGESSDDAAIRQQAVLALAGHFELERQHSRVRLPQVQQCAEFLWSWFCVRSCMRGHGNQLDAFKVLVEGNSTAQLLQAEETATTKTQAREQHRKGREAAKIKAAKLKLQRQYSQMGNMAVVCSARGLLDIVLTNCVAKFGCDGTQLSCCCLSFMKVFEVAE